MSDKKENPKILIISSANPIIGPGRLAWDYYNAISSRGLTVDLLTKSKVEKYSDILYVEEKKKKNLAPRIINKFLSFFTRRRALSNYNFFYKNESNPPVKAELVLKKITKSYDLVLIFFWQELLSFSTVEKIYDKLQCQIHFRCVDYSPMAGGCHFPFNCEKYQTGCGSCPAWESNNPKDFTYYNVLERERVYNKVKPIVYGNSHMQNYYKKSYLLRDYSYEWASPLIDEKEFYPMDNEELRIKYEIPKSKKFIIFFGAQSVDSPRKGINYLLEALTIFYNKLSKEERNQVLLLIAGKNSLEVKQQLKFPYKGVGYVSVETLPQLYSLADVYLSPSIEDAGPMMVNQSLSCGTPVVAFELGTALDVIKDKETGYCAQVKNAEDFASGIEWIFRMDSQQHTSISENCRKVAIETTSCKARVDNVIGVYRKYQR